MQTLPAPFAAHQMGSVTVAAVCSGGARLSLPDAGVTLTVPEAALKTGHMHEMYLAVLAEDCYRPNITGKSTISASLFNIAMQCAD